MFRIDFEKKGEYCSLDFDVESEKEAVELFKMMHGDIDYDINGQDQVDERIRDMFNPIMSYIFEKNWNRETMRRFRDD